jgi:hypothetical protein
MITPTLTFGNPYVKVFATIRGVSSHVSKEQGYVNHIDNGN